MTDDVAILATDVSKSFGDVVALDGVSLRALHGRVFGLLGPNGAGKTTLVRILTTLSKPDSGTASVAGVDVRDPARVRARIGLAGQYAAVDEMLTGAENLELVAGLYGHSRQQARARTRELLDRFSLSDAAARVTKTYSGGMRRRLDLAASLVNRPPVLILDEPTTGLDPSSRLELWGVIDELVSDGTTVLLTTQYLEEADRLATQIMVIDRGKSVAEGSPDELKDQMGGDVLELQVAPDDVSTVVPLLRGLGVAEPSVVAGSGQISVTVGAGATSIIEAVRRLDAAAIAVVSLELRRPSLDEVFIGLTGGARTEPDPSGRPRTRQRSAA